MHPAPVVFRQSDFLFARGERYAAHCPGAAARSDSLPDLEPCQLPEVESRPHHDRLQPMGIALRVRPFGTGIGQRLQPVAHPVDWGAYFALGHRPYGQPFVVRMLFRQQGSHLPRSHADIVDSLHLDPFSASAQRGANPSSLHRHAGEPGALFVELRSRRRSRYVFSSGGDTEIARQGATRPSFGRAINSVTRPNALRRPGS